MNNYRNNGTSGTLKLQLWATTTPYTGGNISGYQLGEVSLGQLSGNTFYAGVAQNTQFTPPPDGTYYITMILTEFNGNDVIVDYTTFNETRTFTNNSGGGNNGQSGAVTLNCPCGYEINGSTLNLSATQVLNSRSGGSSGTLKLKLWASSTRYTGGAISGYILGETRLGELNGGQMYSDIQSNTTLRKPPDGTYSITMTLTEYNGEDVIIDYISFDNTQRFTSNTTPPPVIGAGTDAAGGSTSLAMLLMLFMSLLVKRRR